MQPPSTHGLPVTKCIIPSPHASRCTRMHEIPVRCSPISHSQRRTGMHGDVQADARGCMGMHDIPVRCSPISQSQRRTGIHGDASGCTDVQADAWGCTGVQADASGCARMHADASRCEPVQACALARDVNQEVSRRLASAALMSLPAWPAVSGKVIPAVAGEASVSVRAFTTTSPNRRDEVRHATYGGPLLRRVAGRLLTIYQHGGGL